MISVMAKPVLRLEGPGGSCFNITQPTMLVTTSLKSRKRAVVLWPELWLVTAMPT